MARRANWTIGLRGPDGAVRKITKIVGLNGKGFSVLVPYHRASSGFLCKMPVDPVQPYAANRWESMVAFTAEDKVKLSYHTDGFAQFSGTVNGQIISGIDAQTGMPKGLGLFTNPLTAPIWTGGSVGVTTWGLDEFELPDDTDQLVTFEKEDIYYRGCEPAEADAWILQFYALPIRAIPPMRYKLGQPIIEVAAETLNGRLMSVVEMKVLALETEVVLLGVYANAFKHQYPVSSGWMINGPGDHAAGRRGHVLMAIYPREGIPAAGRESLARNAADASKPRDLEPADTSAEPLSEGDAAPGR